MKHFLLIICMLLITPYVCAEKRYLLVSFTSAKETGNPPYAHLYGDIPSGLNAKLSGTYFGITKKASDDYEVEYLDKFKAELFNLLAEKGFVVDSFVNTYAWVLFSRVVEPQNSTGGVTRVSSEEPTEIARYNLQGLPVTEFDKGVQIIVYSNYTTKTILVQ